MPQKIFTQKFGEIEFIRTWTNGTMHIGKLKDGGYAHITGLPVNSREELELCIPQGKELEDAFNWFEHRNDPVEDATTKRLVMQPEGGYVFDDGSQVATISDLVNHLRPGPALDAAVQWFSEKQRQDADMKAAAKKAKASPVGKAAMKAMAAGAAPEPDAKGEVEITD